MTEQFDTLSTLETHYHHLFDDEIEKEIITPLKADIINTLTGFIDASFGGHSFVDDEGNKVKVIIKVTKDNYDVKE